MLLSTPNASPRAPLHRSPSGARTPRTALHLLQAGATLLVLLAATLPVAVLPLSAAVSSPPTGKPPAPDAATYQREILPVLREFCFDCHGDGSKKGGVSLEDGPHGAIPRVSDPTHWLAVWRNVDAGLMPPPEKPQPSQEQRTLLKRWIESDIFRVDPANPDPGRVSLHRLNREEYRHTIADLLGVDFAVDMRFPADDSGGGFDNNADVLSISPLLMEKYLDAAKRIVGQWSSQSAPVRPPLFAASPMPPDPGEARSQQRALLEKFAFHAFRRPPDKEVMERIFAVCAQEQTVEQGLHTGMMLILSSPSFLFRIEPPPPSGVAGVSAPLDEFSLASRLSYFLWNSCPDTALLEKAARGALRASLQAEIERLLKDPKSHRFSRSFTSQWLQTRDTVSVPISVRAVLGTLPYKEYEQHFNSRVRSLLRQETETLVHHVLMENRPAEELLTARYTFLNKALAEFYGIRGVAKSEFTRVELPPETGRIGILTHGSFLLITSNPTRTSPVKRGLFVLDNLLGTPVPPPPANVPPLEEKKHPTQKLTMRQMMEAHREDALCASCHARMDPIGLALESFNAIGLSRETTGDTPVDTAGKLVTGEAFHDIPELAHILSTTRKGDFYRRLSEKMLGYAIGRSLEYTDTPAVNQLVETLHSEAGSLQALIRAIAGSAPFDRQRVSDSKLAIDAPPR